MVRSNNFLRNASMWLLASLFYAYQFVLRVLPNIMMPDLMRQFNIDASIFGQLSGVYYIGYAGMHIPIGILLDKFGPKTILPVCMVLAACGLLPFVYAQTWIYPCLGRFIIGVSSSAAILGLFKIIRMAYREELFTRMLGASVTIGLLGAIYGGYPVRWLLENIGWYTTFHLLILVGVVMAVITFIIVPSIKNPTSTSVWTDLKNLFLNRKIVAVCFLAGCMVGPMEGFADGWSTIFLTQIYHLGNAIAASLPSMIYLGMCIGAPLLSLLAEKTKAYYEIIAMSAFIMCASFILLLAGSLQLSFVSLVFFIIGLLCAYQILAIYKASSYAKESNVGITTAFANMIIMFFGYVFHTAIGKVAVHFWDGTVLQGIPFYSTFALRAALGIIPIMLFVGLLGFSTLAIQEKRT
ncbi:MAG TPA: MFS transporter [Gammaproteobacteria bacterium]|nr:MFS transporter [Gammaproteobacteria bacterium]